MRKKFVTEDIKTWKQFFEVAPKYSGRIVIVESAGDVLTAPLKALGYSLNSVDPTELNAARELLRGLAPHVLVLDSDDVRRQAAHRKRPSSASTWTGGIVELKAEDGDRRHRIRRPEDGTLYWMDSWVLLKDAPHPEAAYAWLNFIHEPAIQAKETETNYYATPNDEAKKLVGTRAPGQPDRLRARRGLSPNPRGRPGRVERPAAHRDLGGVLLHHRRLSGARSDRPMTARDAAPRPLGRRPDARQWP